MKPTFEIERKLVTRTDSLICLVFLDRTLFAAILFYFCREIKRKKRKKRQMIVGISPKKISQKFLHLILRISDRSSLASSLRKRNRSKKN